MPIIELRGVIRYRDKDVPSLGQRHEQKSAVEHQLEDAEICLRDQGTTGEKLEDELSALRELFEAHAHREIAAVMRFLASGDGTLH